VEDDDAVADYLRLCLELMGYTIADVCCYGEDAVIKAGQLRPDLILMDIKLRGALNGVEAVDRIHSANDIPVVYLTAYEDDDILQSANVSDPFGYLLKPFREAELKQVIEIALYRHRMEKDLREREESYRLLAESLPGIVCRSFLENDKKMVFFNNMLKKMTGYEAAELVTGTFCRFEALLLPEDLPILYSALSKAIAEDKPFEMEYRIRHKDGSIKYFLERGRATKSKEGKTSFIDSVILDMTERRSAEDKLEKAYQKLMERQTFIESILSNIQSGIIVTDIDLRIILMNPSAEKFLKTSSDVGIGKPLESLCPTFKTALQTDGPIDEFLCKLCAKEHVIGFKMFDLKGKDELINGHIISFADLTEIVKIRKEMKKKQQLATLGEFVARVAHEIRNPLFGMTAICQIFSMELILDEEHKKLMDSMMNEAYRLKHVVEELLDCSRELKLLRTKCDLVKMVDDTLFENEPFIREKNISIDKKLSDSSFSVDADQDKIKQVVINLLRNAIEASPKGGSIKIYMETEQGHVRFYISDSGPGIPDPILDKIFDLFYTTKRHGTGLGLAISKNIIVAHGGALVGGNNPEGGANFVFTLPVSL